MGSHESAKSTRGQQWQCWAAKLHRNSGCANSTPGSSSPHQVKQGPGCQRHHWAVQPSTTLPCSCLTLNKLLPDCELVSQAMWFQRRKVSAHSQHTQKLGSSQRSKPVSNLSLCPQHSALGSAFSWGSKRYLKNRPGEDMPLNTLCKLINSHLGFVYWLLLKPHSYGSVPTNHVSSETLTSSCF